MGENPRFEEFKRSLRFLGNICFFCLAIALYLKNYWVVAALSSMILGMWCNFFVMFHNGGRMPVSLKIAKLSTILRSPDHCPLTPSTKYKFLADIIPYRTTRKRSAISIGDILYMGGYIFLGFYIFLRFTIFIGTLV